MDAGKKDKVVAALKSEVPDVAAMVIMDEAGTVLVNTSKSNDAKELGALPKAFDDREAAVMNGVVLEQTRYEVHKHHPECNPGLVYGRTMHPKEDPLNSTGFMMAKFPSGPTGKPLVVMATYAMPNISARMIPEVTAFINKHFF
ncbi:unnamed protein product [Pedinophyceae sp. YPF-701]|nr:unnamed protein product [Pedinophyceae sp. YPF-701]